MTKAPPASQKWVKNKQAGGGGLHPCKWVLLVQHNFVDEAVAAITTGLTNVEGGGVMEVQVCWKILVKVHLYVQEGKLQEEYGSRFTFLFHSIFASALC